MKRFDEIWQQYEKELSHFVLSRVYDMEIQKEIMQEVAVKVFTSMHQQKEHLRGWIYQLTKNVIVDYYRKENRPFPELKELEEPDEHLMQGCLVPMLHQLTSQEQEILEMRYFKEFSIAEIATEKQLPLNTAKSQLHRAKKALGKAFFSCCEYERGTQGEVVDFRVKSQMSC